MSDDRISTFESEHAAVLLDAGHPEHLAKLDARNALYQAKYDKPASPAALQPPANVAADGAFDQSTLNDMDAWVSAPSSPDGYEWKMQPVPEESVIDPQFEQTARDWMFDAGVSKADGLAISHVYFEEMNTGFTPERSAQLAGMTMSSLHSQYGDKAEDAIMAARRVATEMDKAKPGLIDFLEQTGLGNHPRIVATFISRAKARGYF